MRALCSPFTESGALRPLAVKTVKRREEKDSGGSKEETANHGVIVLKSACCPLQPRFLEIECPFLSFGTE